MMLRFTQIDYQNMFVISSFLYVLYSWFLNCLDSPWIDRPCTTNVQEWITYDRQQGIHHMTLCSMYSVYRHAWLDKIFIFYCRSLKYGNDRKIYETQLYLYMNKITKWWLREWYCSFKIVKYLAFWEIIFLYFFICGTIHDVCRM